MSILVSTKVISIIYFVLPENHFDNAVFVVLIVFNRNFFPFGRADLTVSASLQRICGGQPQLHPLRLASTATSTRE
jgi:hypothetical protein